MLGDRLGAKRVLVAGLLVQAFGALAYVFVRDLAGFYAVAAVFGFVYAGTMPLYAAIARANFPLKIMGTVIGGTAMAGSLGMSAGPVAGGLIYDTFGSYTWLYVGSWAHGTWRVPDRDDVQAVPKTCRKHAGGGTGNGLTKKTGRVWRARIRRRGFSSLRNHDMHRGGAAGVFAAAITEPHQIEVRQQAFTAAEQHR